MEKQNLWDFSMRNIETVLNQRFAERKMTKKLREQIASDMAIIASNAYRMGYYAHSMDTEYKPLTTDDFYYSNEKCIQEITWRIQEARK